MTLAKERRYDLDWLRVLGVLLLVPFHVALIFVLSPHSIMYVKDLFNSPALDKAAGFVYMWHMPLLFIIAGSATHFALGYRSAGQYLRERLLRLLVPFIFGVLTLIPLTTYIHRIGTLTLWEHYTGFFLFDLNHLDGFDGSFTPAHLWFILYLFVYSLIALPLFTVLRTEKGQRAIRAVGRFTQAPATLVLWGIPLALTAALNVLGDKNPLYFFLLFFYGYLLASQASFQRSIDKLTWFALAYGIFEAVFRNLVPQAQFSSRSWQSLTLGLMFEMGRWCLTLAVLGLGHRFLNRTSRLLKYASEAAMPFYVLHMTFSVLAGYFVLQLPAPVIVKYPLIVVLATSLTLGAYELVRRWNVTRWLLGMRLVHGASPIRVNEPVASRN